MNTLNEICKKDFYHMPPERLMKDIVKKKNRILEIIAEMSQILKKGI